MLRLNLAGLDELAQDGHGVRLAARSLEEFLRYLAARSRALYGLEEVAQDGHGVRLAARSLNEFLRYLAARSRALCALFFFSCIAYAQSPFGYGIKGGVPLTNEYSLTQSTIGTTSSGKDYIVGPFVELRLLFGLSVEADALYRPVDFQNLNKIGNSLITGNYTSWEFPVLAKYHFRLPVPIVKPLIEAGPAFRAHSSSLPDFTASGFALGGGVEFKLPLIRLSSDLRYTRWTSPGTAATTSPNLNQVELLFGLSF